ncbi:MAG: hypothetical protein H7X85_08080 [Thermoanaerobaculia bacterium]|nr:hypothetical protein [Thermoanaerobaculia bacterium]
MRRVLRFLPLFAAAAFALAGEIADRIAATVNEVAIPETAVRRAMVVSALTPEPGESPESFRARVLDALIDQLLQYEEALRFGPPPPDAAAVEAAMERLQQKLRAEGKDPEGEFAAAGMTMEEVRDTLERQIVVQRYLVERFRPVAIADEARAREEYEKNYVPERQAAGLPAPPFEQVAEEMRTRSQERIFEEEVSKWMRELRARSRVAVYRIPIPVPPGRTPVVISTAPAERRTPTARIPSFTPSPAARP